MVGLDTNVLVRYIMQDDPAQSARASAVIESLSLDQPGFISLVAVVELVWVLGGSYKLQRVQIAAALDTLLRSKELVLDRAEVVAQALRGYRAGSADFADELIARIATAAGCSHTLSFDAKAVKSAGMVMVA